MKKHTNPLKLLMAVTLMLLTSSSLFAKNDPEVEKKKTYSKSYQLSSSDRVRITNQFGEVLINTWDKSEVKVEVSILGRARTDADAQEIIDGISILDDKSGSTVSFETKIKNKWNNNNNKNRNDNDNDDDDKEDRKSKGDRKKGNTGMEVNYVVYMPSSSPLDLNNQFGKTTVPDFKGPIEINQKFGDLVAGKLSNVKELNVEFGSATVESVSECKFSIKFSKAEIRSMSGNMRGNFEFCDNVKVGLTNKVTDFVLNNSYSKIEIDVADDFNGDFNIHTNFGEFNNKAGLAIKEKKDPDEDSMGPKFDKDFVGKTGTGAVKVKIKNSFGNVSFK